MRAVVQRVADASVTVDGEVLGKIGSGLLVLLGVGEGDSEADVTYLAQKIVNLRIFAAEDGRFDRSLIDEQGSLLAVSNFTLFGDCSRGRRPSFSTAARPEVADPLYDCFCREVEAQGITVERGVFGAHMHVALTNDGPVTLLLDSRHQF